MATGDFCEEYNCSIERKNYVKNCGFVVLEKISLKKVSVRINTDRHFFLEGEKYAFRCRK